MPDLSGPYNHILISLPAEGGDADDGEVLVPVGAGEGEPDSPHFIGLESRQPFEVGRVVRSRKPLTARELAEADGEARGQGGEAVDPGRLADIGFMLQVISEFGAGALLRCRYSRREGEKDADVLWELFDDRLAELSHWRGPLAEVEPEPWMDDDALDGLIVARQEAAERQAREAALAAERRTRERAEAAERRREEEAQAQERRRAAAEESRARRERAAEEAAGRTPAEGNLGRAAALDPELAAWLDLDFEDEGAPRVRRPAPGPADMDPELAAWLDDGDESGDDDVPPPDSRQATAPMDPDLADWLDEGDDEDDEDDAPPPPRRAAGGSPRAPAPAEPRRAAPAPADPDLSDWLDDSDDDEDAAPPPAASHPMEAASPAEALPPQPADPQDEDALAELDGADLFEEDADLPDAFSLEEDADLPLAWEEAPTESGVGQAPVVQPAPAADPDDDQRG